MNDWNKIADKKTIEETINSLKERNIDVFFAETSKEAKEIALNLIPKNARVLANQSQTLKQIGLDEEIENSGKYISVRKEYMSLDHEKDAQEIRMIRSTPQVIIGSVHAITQKGEVVTASNTGSQIAAYAYSAQKVIWVIGSQKIVKDLSEANERVYEHVLPLESERLKKLYGVSSNVSKLLIYNKEPVKGRVTAIIVNESLGF